jgi:hypothetical protein
MKFVPRAIPADWRLPFPGRDMAQVMTDEGPSVRGAKLYLRIRFDSALSVAAQIKALDDG